jgi:SAM-dependent methyltransferase
MGDFGRSLDPGDYWEGRARRFAAAGEGLAAVCSYGMPAFYNRAIQHAQRLALEPWLHVPWGTRVLDVGCGVGRWSRLLAARGARVTGVDLSATMIEEARRRAVLDAVHGRCRFEAADVTRLALGERYELIVGVTVLQHVLDPAAFARAVRNLADHLAPRGRMVLLEAAPTRRVDRCDTPIFTARDAASYEAAFRDAGLEVHAVTGVDPAPFKTLLLPHYARLPGALKLALLGTAVALAWPIDTFFGRLAVSASWHKVFVLRHGTDRPA